MTGPQASVRIGSPLGPLVLTATEGGLAALAFPERTRAATPPAAARGLPDPLESDGRLGDHLAAAGRQLQQYFAGTRGDFDVVIDWSVAQGFTREVLQAVTEVRYGQLATYAGLAKAVGSPRAARAVGNALGANPLAIVVPCHRVVRSDGGVGGYTSGQPKKAFLLDLEQSRAAGESR